MNAKINVKASKEDLLGHLRRVAKEGRDARASLLSRLKDTENFTETLVDCTTTVVQKCAAGDIAERLVSALEADRWQQLDELATYSVQEAMRHLGSLYGSQSTNRLEAPKRAAQGYFWSELSRVLAGLR